MLFLWCKQPWLCNTHVISEPFCLVTETCLNSVSALFTTWYHFNPTSLYMLYSNRSLPALSVPSISVYLLTFFLSSECLFLYLTLSTLESQVWTQKLLPTHCTQLQFHLSSYMWQPDGVAESAKEKGDGLQAMLVSNCVALAI